MPSIVPCIDPDSINRGGNCYAHICITQNKYLLCMDNEYNETRVQWLQWSRTGTPLYDETMGTMATMVKDGDTRQYIGQ